MEVNILAFGKIADITARSAWKMEGVRSSSDLREQLEAQYPALRDMRYQIAVDKKIVNSETQLTDGTEVALLPPFSGG